jgi:hypothetical protein
VPEAWLEVSKASPMSIRISEVSLENDGPTLIGLIRSYLAPGTTRRRFEWLYCNGPHGSARAWLAWDRQDGNVLGMAAAFPRTVHFRGEQRLAWVFGDFCMNQNYRTLGPAVALQRRCLEEAGDSSVGVCYDFPSRNMVAVYRRLGIQQTTKLIRWAKPLRTDVRIQAAIGSRTVARCLSALPDIALAWHGWKGQKTACELSVHTDRCEVEFTELDSAPETRCAFRTARSAEYLNWRYLDHPETKYEILTARRGGALIGYAIFCQDGNYATVADLCSKEEPAVIARLLAGVAEIVRVRDVVTLNLYSAELHPWSWIFEKCGFHRRETAPVIACSPHGADLTDQGSEIARYLMNGDRES